MNCRIFTLAVMLLAFAASITMAQVIHYEQNFDALANGDLDGQDGWAVGAPANMASPVVTSDVKHGPAGKSLEVSGSQEVIRDFDPMIDSGTQFLSIWFRIEEPGADKTLHIYFGESTREWNAGPVIRIGSQSGDPNQVGVHDGGTVKPVAPIRKGEWQHLLSVMDVDNQTYSVFVDEELAADNFSWRNPAGHKKLGWLMLGFDQGADLIGYYDDLIFGEGDTPPSAAVQPDGKIATTWAAIRH